MLPMAAAVVTSRTIRIQQRRRSAQSSVAVVLGLALVLVTAIGPTASARVAGVAATTSPTGTALAGVPPSTQSNISPYPVLQRLGRWDGTTFQPVTAGSLPAGHLVVLSHGWSPGYLDSYQRLQAQSTTLVTVWTPGLVNGANLSMMATWAPMAQALQRADPTATVVLFSWVDQSATSDDPLQARVGEDATEVNGHRLATALDQAVAPGFSTAGGQVHLIGHSFGANVATTAALAMAVPPRQLTLLDSPESTLTLLGGAKNDLRYKLPRLDIGRGPGQTFVDNYISFVGIRYAPFPGLDQVVDVQTAPPPGDGPGDKHSFAIVWYRTSAENLGGGVGLAWSPLLGANDATLGSLYQQPDPANLLALTEVEGPPAPGVRTQLLVADAAFDVPGAGGVRAPSPTGTAAPGTVAPKAPATAVAPPAPTGVALGGSAPTTWNLTFATDQTSLWLDFDLTLTGRPGDSVAVFVDGRQRSQAATDSAGTGEPGAFVILYDVTPGDHVLTVSLTGASSTQPADRSTVATVSGLRLSSTADIQRNLTADETDGLLIAALIVLVLVIMAMVAFVVFVIGRLRRLARSHRDHQPPSVDR